MADQDQTQTQTSKPELPEIVNIETVDQFAQVTAAWHGGMLARLRHLREVPHGTEITLEEPDGSKIKVKLKGDGMKGFQAALNACIAELEAFPFVMTTEEVPAEAQADAEPSKD